MRRKILLGSLLMFLSAMAFAVNEGNIEREQRMQDEIVDAIFDGEPIALASNGHEFLAIMTEADNAKGVVIIIHGRGFHPDWPEAINPLRSILPEMGWSTLSLQMPVLKKTAKYYDYQPLFDAGADRLNAGLDFLKSEGHERVVVLAHSCGAHMAMHRVDQQGLEGVAAFIGLGLGATDYHQYMPKPFPLTKLKMPVLDVFGEDDYPAVKKMAEERAKLIKQAGNAQSRQVIVLGADHYYTDKGEALTQVVGDWLNSVF